ncbi:MAG: hypothetical protein Q4A37_03200 [Candidatus Saccharibacteria bacterium]|nr:hypothetical protein [Candidatus Saccharibacteria bacterium]
MEVKKKILLIARARTSDAKERAKAFANKIQDRVGSDIEIENCEISELFFELSKDKVAIYHSEKNFDLREFDLVVIRHIGNCSVEAHAITQYCEYFNIPYMDRYLNRLLLDNKVSTQFTLWFAGIKDWPHTFYGDRREMRRRFHELGGRAILKDNEGSRGRLNFLVSSADEIDNIHTEHPGVRFVLQECIPNSGDFRVLIFNDKPALAIKRVGVGGSHLNNTSQGGCAHVVPMESLPKKVVDACVAAARAVKLQVAGVDVMFDDRDNSVYFLEINNAPQISTGSFTEEKADKYSQMLVSMVKGE